MREGGGRDGMRIVVAIPHHFGPGPDDLHASGDAEKAAVRAAALGTAIAALHAHFGGAQHELDHTVGATVPANTSAAREVAVIVCTTRGRHLVDRLPVSPALYTHRECDVEPPLLGFECQAALCERLDEGFDYYCYLEDDLVVRDPLFFDKQRWFGTVAGDRCVLQPNRFEMAGRREFQKLYLDGDRPPFPTAGDGHADLEREFLGRSFRFTRPSNPHAGTYFLTRAQMAFWTRQPHFLDRDCAFVGPLESAATLGLVKTFTVFKPARESAHFLEVEHFSPDHSPRVGTWFAIGGLQRPASLVGRLADGVARRLGVR
jgi:hypothetical protein